GIINASLAAFNLIPGFPLDGGRVLRSVVWMTTGDFRRATNIASSIGIAIAYLFIVGGVWMAFTSSLADGLWIAFVGWFLENAAQNSRRQLALQEALRGVKVRDVMSTDCAYVAADISVHELVEDYVLPTGRRCFVVTGGGELLGLATLHNVKQLPRERWTSTAVSAIMSPVEELKMASPGDEVSAVLQRMDQEDVNQMPVVHDGRFLGLIARDNLLRLIRTRSELRV
ncbi:MAG: CBS domain-containing protein, partial [Chloroflexota bacterium]